MMFRTPVPADADERVALLAACFPFRVATAASLRHEDACLTAEMRPAMTVCEVDGRVVGFASTLLDPESAEPGVMSLNLMVDPEHRGRGVGRELYRRMRAHQDELGASRVIVRVVEDGGRAFGERRGFAANRVELISSAPLTPPMTVPEPPPGITLRPVSELADLEAVYELDCAVSADVPMDAPFVPLDYPTWRRLFIEGPLFDADCSVVAFEDDTAVSMSMVETAPPRLFNGLAGTRASHRNRGLASLVKRAALARAAARGVTVAFTNNDAGNAAMLAVNRRLGYAPAVEQTTMVRRA